MGTCEMCGMSTEDLRKVQIERTTLEACPNCAKYGKPVKEVKMPKFVDGYDPRRREFTRTFKPKPARKEAMRVIVDDYAVLIRNARNRLGLKQKEFAKKLNEKESIMQKIESGSFQPTIEQARKFEKALKITLVEEYSEESSVPISAHKSSSEGMTMGDFIKDKK